MANLRDQFTATSTKVLKEVVDNEDSKISKGGYSDYLEMEDGLNKFRIFPKHPGESTFSLLHACHWITFVNDQNEEKRITVPNSKIHGNTDKDIIEEYIAFVKRTLDLQNPDHNAKIKKLTGYPTGMDKQTTWLCYAKKVGKNEDRFGLWDMKRTVRDALNDASIIEAEGESIEVDPFTHPDTGIPVLVTYNSKAKKFKDYYKVQLSKNAMPLTDAELETFAKIKPLSQLPQVNYGSAEFILALEGIKFFDEENEVELFDTEEFQAIVEELRLEYDEQDAEVSEIKKENAVLKGGLKKKPTVVVERSVATKKGVSKLIPIPFEEEIDEEEIDEEIEEEIEGEIEEEIEEEIEQDKYDAMDRLALRTLIAKNPDLKKNVLVYQKDTDDEIRNKIREFMASPFVEDGPEKPIKKVSPVPVSSAVKKPVQSLDEIKAKLKANKK